MKRGSQEPLFCAKIKYQCIREGNYGRKDIINPAGNKCIGS